MSPGTFTQHRSIPCRKNSYARMRQLFDEAMLLPPGERTHWIRSQWDGRSAVAEAVVELLAAEEKPEVTFPCGVHRTMSVPPPPPLRIGAYDIISELGEGGMGKVYRARRRDGTFKNTVAVKVLMPRLANEVNISRFQREGQTLAALGHPNIPTLLDSGVTSDGIHFLVMELVEGDQLDRYCQRTAADLHRRLELFYNLCLAVDYVHSQGMVHRDLKPSSVLVDDSGLPKLLDFGISQPAGEVVERSGGLTLSHASPEQFHGLAICHRSDIYSLGVILYQLIAGRRPFEELEGRPVALLYRILQSPPPPASQFAQTPLPLDAVVLRCLHADPEQRYASASQLAEAVNSAFFSVRESAPSSSAVLPRSFVWPTIGFTAIVPLLLVAPYLAVHAKKAGPVAWAVETCRPSQESRPLQAASVLPVSRTPTKSTNPGDEFQRRHADLSLAISALRRALHEQGSTRINGSALRIQSNALLYAAEDHVRLAAERQAAGDGKAAERFLRDSERFIDELRQHVSR